MLGGLGVGTGALLGWLASLVMTRLRAVRFPEGLAEVYMVDSIPLTVLPGHLLAVLAVCVLLVVAASYWPAWKASRLDPVTALKAV
jgi:ABC-type lipoprotein release transport system permease subunit